MKIEIRELNTKQEMMLAFPLINQMYEIDRMKFSDALDEMIKRNQYKIIAAIKNDEMVGICGYWISYMLYCGRYLQACNFFVDEENRKCGIGKKMLGYLEEKAKIEKCD